MSMMSAASAGVIIIFAVEVSLLSSLLLLLLLFCCVGEKLFVVGENDEEKLFLAVKCSYSDSMCWTRSEML